MCFGSRSGLDWLHIFPGFMNSGNAMDISPHAFSKKKFDYIIIGGGTVGLALATLLSNDESILVGVVEAGIKTEDDVILIPGYIGQSLGNPVYDWNFMSIPQSHAEGRQIPMFRGKVLGGTSALNYMAFTRGSQEEHNSWSKLGIEGWNWQTIQAAINASEQWTPPPAEIASMYHANNDPENHGLDGFVKTSTHPCYYDLAIPLFETMNLMGVPTNLTAASGNPIGVWTETASIDPSTRKRSYSVTAYLDPNAHRKNLVVLTAAHALRVNFSQQVNNNIQKATGIEFKHNDEILTAGASREIIICAGSIQTPQLLELSGIGNPDILNGIGITPMIDLPGVGENLQDHICVSIGASLRGKHITAEDMRIPEFAAEQVNAYKETKSGYLSGTPSTFVFLNARAFIPADVLDKLVSVLEQLLKKPAFQSSPWRKVYQLQRDWLVNDGVAQLEIVLFPAYDGPGASKEPDARHYTLSVFLQHSWSRGKVHAISRSALEPPAIDLAILDSPEQIDTVILVQAIRYAFKIMSTGAMGVETQQILNPSPKSTDEELAAYVRKNVNSAWHPVGTASMLPREDFGVVDNSLKVYGTSNLRVVDASVIPINVGTHPQAMLYGLAHRAVDIISAARATT